MKTDDNLKKYSNLIFENDLKLMRDKENLVPGWYGRIYYERRGDKLVPVESVDGDNSLNYPD